MLTLGCQLNRFQMFSSAFAYVRLSAYLHLAVDRGLMFTSCPGILVTWSPEDVDVGIRATLIQIYPILLSTLLSINRQTLSLFDATYALLLTSSPLTGYLIITSFCDLLGFETNLFKRIKSGRRAIRILGALIPFLWIGLSMSLRLSDQAFVGSEYCRSSSFKEWLSDLYHSFLTPFETVGGLLLGFGFPPIFILVFGLCLFRRRSQTMEDFRAHRKEESKSWGGFRIPWTFAKCAWCVSVVVTLVS